MNRGIRIQRGENHPVTRVYEGLSPHDSLQLFEASYTCSRIWMGVVPPEEDQPGYAAVVGELMDSDVRQRERPVMLLDEGIALDPLDFNTREREQFGIRDDNLLRPTKRRLAEAVVALKDLWWPWQILVPPGVGSQPDIKQRSAPWVNYLRNADGLTNYDVALGPGYFREWFPFYTSMRRTVAGIIEVPFEDRAYNRSLLEALTEADRFTVASNCTIYLQRKLPCCDRCISMVLSEMEYQDLTPVLRAQRFGVEYEDLHRNPEREDMLRETADAREDKMRWLMGQS